MFSKAMSKWTIELFICMLIVVAGIILALIAIPGFFISKLCPKAQAEEIQKVMNKVNEMKGRPGYEVINFEVKKECVEYVTYDQGSKNLMVQYTTTEGKVPYSTGFEWDFGGKNLGPKTYPLRVYEDRVELNG